MATPTNAQLLAKTQEAINQILVTGQSYEIGPRKLTRADLGQLMKLKESLEWQVYEETNGTGGIGIASMSDPS